MNRILLTGLLVLAALLRLPMITADPPGGDLSRSAALLTDESIYNNNALHWFVRGDWYIEDGFNPAVNTPLYLLAGYAFLKTGGSSLSSLRYGAVLISLFALLLFAVLMRGAGQKAQALAPALAAVAFVLVQYNRLALVENLLLAALLAQAVVLVRWVLPHPERSGRLLVLALLWCAGVLVKATALFFAGVIVAALLIYGGGQRWRAVGLFCLAAAVLVLLVQKFWIARFPEDWAYFSALNISQRLPDTPVAFISNWLRFFGRLKLFEFMPLIFCSGLLAFSSAVVRWRRLPVLEGVLLLWFALGLSALSLVAYSPPRYMLIVLPPLIGFSALFWQRLFSDDHPLSAVPEPAWWLMAVVVVAQLAFSLFRYLRDETLYPSLFLPLAAAAFMLWLFRRRFAAGLKKTARVWFAVLLAIQLGQSGRWFLHAEFSVHEMAREVAGILGKDRANGSVIAGDIAALAGLEAGIPALDIMYRRDRLPALWQRWQPRYLLLEDPAELARLRRDFPALILSAAPVRRFRVMGNYLRGQDAVLYAIE